MLRLAPMIRPGSPCTILCFGAHCDDIEIGCGGTLLKLVEDGHEITCHWVVASSNPQRVMFLAAACWTMMPTLVDPVNEILSTLGSEVRAPPISGFDPGTKLTAPAGAPAAARKRINSNVEAQV